MPAKDDVLKMTDDQLKVAFADEVAGGLLADYSLDTIIQHVKEWCSRQGNWLFVFYWDNKTRDYHTLVGEDDKHANEAHEATHKKLHIAVMQAAVMATREE